MCHSKWGHFFLSSLWGGRILDKQLTIWSGHKFVRPSGAWRHCCGRSWIWHWKHLQGSTGLNFPPLLRTKTQFDEGELEETPCIANLHVHVEQAMERIKNSTITHYFLGSPCSMAESSLHVHFWLSSVHDKYGVINGRHFLRECCRSWTNFIHLSLALLVSY